MTHALQFYIDGQWTAPVSTQQAELIDPSTEQAFARIAMGTVADVDRAVAAARAAFPAYAATSPSERAAMFRRIVDCYRARAEDLALTVSREIGAPLRLARDMHVPLGLSHLNEMERVLKEFPFATPQGSTLIVREPIGVCALITPWNWPLNQIINKVGAALAAGCTMVLKPSELAPLNALLLAEILHDARVPPGVFNLVNGEGGVVGHALAVHADVDMISFTGSTRAGILVAKAAADTVKRVHQELGGKSPNIILPDADLETAVTLGAERCFRNSGQSCNAPTRMFLSRGQYERAAAIAKGVAESKVIGPPSAEGTWLGPVAGRAQFEKIQRYIALGIDAGADLVAGGLGRPEHLPRGYYVRPTVFGNVRNDMSIAREEIFGPVLCLIGYDDEDDAIRQANDTVFGLAAHIQSGDIAHARRVAFRLRAGHVNINYPPLDFSAPFGGYRQSGNGREYSRFGLEEFLEMKSVLGYSAPEARVP